MSGSRETTTLVALVRERIERWRDGGEPNAAAVMEEHPEIRGAKSLVMDLVLAEYSLRTAAGHAVERDQFCDRFPTFRQSIAKMLDVQDFLDKCPGIASADQAAAERLVRWPLLGEEFLGYELVEPLGRGGLARVFLARETKVGRRWVVVKISRHGSQEAAALGKLSHPSVAPIYSVKQDAAGEWTLICMPLLGVATGIDLLDAAFAAGAKKNGALVERVAVETRPLTPVQGSGVRGQGSEFAWDLTYDEAIARIGLQLAEGLEAAHAAGIMHRDLKPSNLLLAWSGRAMLLDFNLSTDGGEASQSIGGTLAYMAPELIAHLSEGRGEAARRFDPRCDVYSLGAVLYELLAGRLPATPANAERLPALAYQPWLDCKRTKIDALAEEVDSRLIAIVLKCLAFDPAGRFATAAELAAELRAFLQRAARPRVMGKVRRRAVLAAAVALLVFGGGIWSYVGTRPLSVEQLHRRGLAEYEQGKYAEAVETFTQCLERRAGWTEALFGRGQALIKLRKWGEARTDFTALQDVDLAWACALGGYCNMCLRENGPAFADFFKAYQHRLRDVGFLMNYARIESSRQRHLEAAHLYSEVIKQEPQNAEAIRRRAMAGFMAVVNERAKIPGQQALDDVEALQRLAPESFESLFCGAIVYGEAAKKEPVHEQTAIDYLTEALRRGLPLEAVKDYKSQVKRLIPYVDGKIVMESRRDPSYRSLGSGLPIELSNTADWTAFRAKLRGSPSLVMETR